MPVRWGLLSTAAISTELVGPLQQSETSDLIAVASRDAGRAAAYAARHGIPASYGSYEDLLNDDAIEAVYIPLPNGLHAEWSRAALEAGKHVLCEKPLTATAPEAEGLFRLAAERGLFLAEAVMYRHHPQTAELRRLVAEELGELRSLHAAFHFPIAALDEDVRSRPELAGGALRDLGSYCISVLNLLAGEEPSKVVGHARLGRRGVDVAFAATMTYADEVTASFDVSMDSPMTLWLVATGSQRSLRVPNPYQPSLPDLWAPGRCPEEAVLFVRGVEEIVPLPGGNPFLREIEDFSRAVRGLPAFVVPAEETVRTMRTIERLLASAGLSPLHEPLAAASQAARPVG
jgi:xylose dehydrogenase (NAD/NADP)